MSLIPKKGTVYVVDIAVGDLDQRALVAVNDLGPLGDCWSMSGPSCADGVLYHRSARELVAIGGASSASRASPR